MDIIINGKSYNKSDKINVLNPFNGDIVDTVPNCDEDDLKKVVDSAYSAKDKIQEMSALKVSNILYSICEDLIEEKEYFSKLISFEKT